MELAIDRLFGNSFAISIGVSHTRHALRGMGNAMRGWAEATGYYFQGE